MPIRATICIVLAVALTYPYWPGHAVIDARATDAAFANFPAFQDDGACDVDELRTLLNTTREEALSSMREYDHDGSGKLSNAELQDLLLSARTSAVKIGKLLSAGSVIILALFGMIVMCSRGLDVASPLSDYELISKLGEGAFGEVFKCHKKSDSGENPVCYAIKFIAVESVPMANNAMAEAVRLARCHHENLVQIHNEFFHNRWKDLGLFERLWKSPYQFCIVMDLCTGGTLLDHMEEWTSGQPGQSWAKPSAKVVIDIVRQIASGCGHLHTKNLVHLDLKPENVFLSPGVAGKGVFCQVGDLGLAEADVKKAKRQKENQALIQELRKETSRPRLKRQLSMMPSKPRPRLHRQLSMPSTRRRSTPEATLEGVQDLPEKQWGPDLLFDRPSGTDGYIAPELWRDCEDITCKCDTWSLGIITVELCNSAFGDELLCAFGILIDKLQDNIDDDDLSRGDIGCIVAHSTRAADNFHVRILLDFIQEAESRSTALDFSVVRDIIKRALDIEAPNRPTCSEIAHEIGQ